MRRMVAAVLALLLCVVPALASEAVGRIQLADGAQAQNAVTAAKKLHKRVIAPGESFSFNEIVGQPSAERGFVPAGEEVMGFGCAQAATALYNALTGLGGAVSFDELSYASDGSGLLVDYAGGHDFRFTNLSSGKMQIVFGQSDGMLMCKVVLEDADSGASAPNRSAPNGAGAIVFECEGDSACLSNIALAVDSIHDTTLASGDVFSFNDIVGPREERFGYVLAPDGRGAEVPGGGVNQLASALWLLIRDRDDIVIVEKSTYGDSFAQTYVSRSSDAIFVDSLGPDFAFRYVGSGSVTLYAVLEDNLLSLSF